MKSYTAVIAIVGALGVIGVYGANAHDNGHDDDNYLVEIDGFGDSDTDGDGRLSRDEFLADQDDYDRGRNLDNANQTFDKIDANGDDFLETDEVEDYASEVAHQAMAAMSDVWDDIDFGFSFNANQGWDDDDWDDDDWGEDDWDNHRHHQFRFALSDEEREALEEDMDELAEDMEGLGQELAMVGSIVGRSIGRAMRDLDRHSGRRVIRLDGHHPRFHEEYNADSDSFIIEREYSGDVDLDSDDIETRIAERKDEIMADMDANGDGVISRDEFSGRSSTFDNMDKNDDDALTRDELRVRLKISRVVGIPRFRFARDN
jgi:EF hand